MPSGSFMYSTHLFPRIFKSRERCKVSSNLLLNVNIKELRRNLCRSKGTLHACVLNFKSINKNIIKSIQTKKPGPCCPPPNRQRSESPQSHRHGAPPWKWRWRHQSHIIYLGNPWKSSELKWWFPRSISLSAQGNSSHPTIHLYNMKTTLAIKFSRFVPSDLIHFIKKLKFVQVSIAIL